MIKPELEWLERLWKKRSLKSEISGDVVEFYMAVPQLISEIRSLRSRLEVVERALESIARCECEDCLCHNEAQQALREIREEKE